MYLTEAQYEVQNRVDRKGTSTYYTSPDGVNVVRELLRSVPRREGIVVMDPFMGSGVLLSAIDDLVKPSKVIGIEINKEPCELGRKILSSLYPEVEVLCGDAFKLAWKYRADLDLKGEDVVLKFFIDNLMVRRGDRVVRASVSTRTAIFKFLPTFMSDYFKALRFVLFRLRESVKNPEENSKLSKFHKKLFERNSSTFIVYKGWYNNSKRECFHKVYKLIEVNIDE